MSPTSSFPWPQHNIHQSINHAACGHVKSTTLLLNKSPSALSCESSSATHLVDNRTKLNFQICNYSCSLNPSFFSLSVSHHLYFDYYNTLHTSEYCMEQVVSITSFTFISLQYTSHKCVLHGESSQNNMLPLGLKKSKRPIFML